MDEIMRRGLTPPILDLTVDRYAAFKIWKQKWNDYKLLTDLDNKPVEFQCAMLRYTFSDETRNIYEALSLSEGDGKDPEKIIEHLETFARGIINETLERHSFNCRKQEEGERFDEFLTEVKLRAKNCNFCATCYPGLLRDRIVGGIRDDHMRQKLLSDSKLTLQKAEDICRAGEKAQEGMNTLKNSTSNAAESTNEEHEEINYVNSRKKFGKKPFANSNFPATTKNRQTPNSCKFCLRSHQFGRDYCPSWGKRCNDCKQSNHFAGSIVCPKKNISEVQTTDEVRVDTLFLGSVEEGDQQETTNHSDWKITLRTKTGSIQFKIDTGADVTVIGNQHLTYALTFFTKYFRMPGHLDDLGSELPSQK